MKKDVKRFISKVLAAAMLLTSSYTGVVFAETPDSGIELAAQVGVTEGTVSAAGCDWTIQEKKTAVAELGTAKSLVSLKKSDETGFNIGDASGNNPAYISFNKENGTVNAQTGVITKTGTKSTHVEFKPKVNGKFAMNVKGVGGNAVSGEQSYSPKLTSVMCGDDVLGFADTMTANQPQDIDKDLVASSSALGVFADLKIGTTSTNGNNIDLSFKVEKGKTYFIAVGGSKLQINKIEFTEDPDETPVETTTAAGGETPVETTTAAGGETPVETTTAAGGETPVETTTTAGGETPVETTTAAGGETPVETTTAAGGETPVETTTSGSQGGGSDSRDYPTTGTGNVTADTAAKIYATATATYKDGKINLTGGGKLFVNFPKVLTKGVVTFKGKMDIKALPLKEYPLMEVNGTRTGSKTSSDLLAIIVSAEGKLGLRNNASGGRVNTMSTIDRPTTEATYKIEVDLDNDVVKAYVNDDLIATDTATQALGVNLAADVEKIESLDKASFFTMDGYESDISELNVAVVGDTFPAEETPVETTTAAPVETTTTGGDTPVETTTAGGGDKPGVEAKGGLMSTVKGVGAAAEKVNFAVNDEVEITYSIKDVTGINNYTFYIDFDPSALEFVEASNVDLAESVSYPFGGAKLPLIIAEAVNAQADYAPEAGDQDFLGGKFDGKLNGTTKARELGRIKIADVTGLNGGNNSVSIATDTAGVLFKAKFKVLKAGAPIVNLTPVTDALFYETPVSGTVGTPIVFKEDSASDVTVPANPETEFKDFSVTAEGVTIAVASKILTATPASLVEYSEDAQGVGTLAIDGDANLEPEALAAALAAATVTGESTTITAKGTTITITQGSVTKIINVTKKAPTKEHMPEFILTVGDTGIVLTSDGKDGYTVTGATLDGDEIVIAKDSALTEEAVLEAFKTATFNPADAASVAVDGKTITITGKNGKTKQFTVKKDSGETPGDVKLTVGGVEIGLAKGETGLTATVAKGKVKEIAGGAIVPVVGSTVKLGDLTVETIGVTGATVKSYDVATKTATVTIAGTDYTVQFYVHGDVNGDGNISVADALMLVNICNNKITANDMQQLAGDVNNDGNISVADALMVINRCNNKITSFPAEA